MAYCKFCGMESNDPKNCQWCKRPLPPVTVTPAVPPATNVAEDKMLAIAEKGRKSFFIACGVLVLLSAILIFLRFQIFPWVMLGALFAVGILLGRFRVIPPFEDRWIEFGVLFLSIVFVPAFFLLLGYVVYGLVTKNLDEDIAWLLGAFFVVLTILEIATFFAFPDRVPNKTLIVFHAVEILGLALVFAGWIVDSSLGPYDR